MRAGHFVIVGIMAMILAGCGTPQTPETAPANGAATGSAADATSLAALRALPTETQGPTLTATPGPSPTATLPGVPPVTCSGTFAYVMTVARSSELHLIDACSATTLSLPDDAGPALDYGVSCDSGSPATSLLWSPDGSRLLYMSDFGGAGHGEIHVLAAAKGSAVSLTPSYTMLDAATGAVVKAGCAHPDECHPGEIKDGQITFINSRGPRWSPDGSEILFESMGFDVAAQNAPVFRHFVMNSAGSNIRALTDQQAANLSAMWASRTAPQPLAPPITYQTTSPGVSVTCSVWHP